MKYNVDDIEKISDTYSCHVCCDTCPFLDECRDDDEHECVNCAEFIMKKIKNYYKGNDEQCL